MVQAYIEAKHLPNYYNVFLTEITLFYGTKGKILLDTGDMDSELMHVYRKYLDAFDDFYVIDARKEFDILESILNSTAMLLKDFGIQPTSEADVYKPIKNICKAAFPDNKDCSHYKFQQTAKCYNPDILIPSLECAVEFKYVNDEKELNRTMDEILADVEGYKGNPSYSVFYAVFYVHIPADTRSAFPVISVQSPVSIQCCWQS